MTLQDKITRALADLISADLKDTDGAYCSASTHRNRAYVLLHSLCPTYQSSSEDGQEILKNAAQEMRDLCTFDRLWDTEPTVTEASNTALQTSNTALLEALVPIYEMLSCQCVPHEMLQLMVLAQVAIEQAQGREPGSFALEQAAKIRRARHIREEELGRRDRQYQQADEIHAALSSLLDRCHEVTLTRTYHEEDKLWRVRVAWQESDGGDTWDTSSRHADQMMALEGALVDTARWLAEPDGHDGVRMADGSVRAL